jgi:hypothetical protein
VNDDLVSVSEIRWALDPLPRLELLPVAHLVALDPGDLLVYAFDLQSELESVRALLHASLAATTQAHVQRDRLQTRVRLLVDELKTARESVRVMSAQLRRQDEAL